MSVCMGVLSMCMCAFVCVCGGNVANEVNHFKIC